MGALGGAGGLEPCAPLLRDEDDPAVLLVPTCVLLPFVKDAEIVRLGDADKLAVVALGPHHPPMVQLVHCRRDPETVRAKKQRNYLSVIF